MDTHKRLLSILHIVYGTASLLIFLTITTIFNSVLPFIEQEVAQDNGGIIALAVVFSIIRIFLIILAVAVPIPSIIGGIALINGKKWGLIPLMISGCASLLSFPIGTGLGVYTIWTYLEVSKKKSDDQS